MTICPAGSSLTSAYTIGSFSPRGRVADGLVYGTMESGKPHSGVGTVNNDRVETLEDEAWLRRDRADVSAGMSDTRSLRDQLVSRYAIAGSASGNLGAPSA
jgi:hypothetical protein